MTSLLLNFSTLSVHLNRHDYTHAGQPQPPYSSAWSIDSASVSLLSLKRSNDGTGAGSHGRPNYAHKDKPLDLIGLSPAGLIPFR